MPARIPEESLAAIERAVAQYPEGASFGDVAGALPERLADRTLQYRLRYLVNKGRLITEGEGRRWTRYRLPAEKAEARPAEAEKPAAAEKTEEEAVPLSPASKEMRTCLFPPAATRVSSGVTRWLTQVQYLPPAEVFLNCRRS